MVNILSFGVMYHEQWRDNKVILNKYWSDEGMTSLAKGISLPPEFRTEISTQGTNKRRCSGPLGDLRHVADTDSHKQQEQWENSG